MSQFIKLKLQHNPHYERKNNIGAVTLIDFSLKGPFDEQREKMAEMISKVAPSLGEDLKEKKETGFGVQISILNGDRNGYCERGYKTFEEAEKRLNEIMSQLDPSFQEEQKDSFSERLIRNSYEKP